MKRQRSMKLAAYNNSWYRPGSAIKIALWSIVNAVFFNHSLAFFSSFKCFLLRMFGAKVGKRVVIKPSVHIKYPWFLNIADDVWIGEKVWIDNLAKVIIDNNVCISQGVLLLTGNHDYKKITFDLIVGTIHLEEGVWLGAQSVVCPGIICKAYSILTVGSVATKSLESYGIYSGIPAEKIRSREILP